MKLEWKTCFKVGISILLLYLCIHYLPMVQSGLSTVLSALIPLVAGACIAYIVNIPMRFYERHYFPKAKNKFVTKSRRPVCLILAILSVTVIIALIISLIVPQLIECVKLIVYEIQIGIEYLVEHATKRDLLPESVLKNLKDFDWYSRIGKLIELLTKGVGGMMEGVVTTVVSVVSGVVTVFLSCIFALYILLSKEQLKSQAKRLLRRYVKEQLRDKICHVCDVVNQSFHSYIVGQCIEAVILGVLCTLGMLALGLPYAPMIGAFMAFTALIPVAGAYIGAIAGALMIITVSPVQSLIFVIFVIILQQVEGNLIYPKVVGSSIGLPGIWVLAAITVGGGIMGVFGMLIGVPIAAAVYTLIREDVEKGEEKARQKTTKPKSEAKSGKTTTPPTK